MDLRLPQHLGPLVQRQDLAVEQLADPPSLVPQSLLLGLLLPLPLGPLLRPPSVQPQLRPQLSVLLLQLLPLVPPVQHSVLQNQRSALPQQPPRLGLLLQVEGGCLGHPHLHRQRVGSSVVLQRLPLVLPSLRPSGLLGPLVPLRPLPPPHSGPQVESQPLVHRRQPLRAGASLAPLPLLLEALGDLVQQQEHRLALPATRPPKFRTARPNPA